MIREKKKNGNLPIIVDLTGPQGNAFALMGMAQNLAKQLRWDGEKIQMLLDEMMSDDYENLIQVFDREFGKFVILER